jgi:archaemetzincin
MNDLPNGRLPFAAADTVVVVAMDGPPAGHIVQLVVDLQHEGVHATLADAAALPESAYDRARAQFRAERLLATARHLDGRRVLGVTDRDLYAEGQDYVYGIAESPGRIAIISLFRLRAGSDTAVTHARALKQAVHELGRTLGLGHCEHPRCVMHRTDTLAAMDWKTCRLCDACLLQASRLGRGGR